MLEPLNQAMEYIEQHLDQRIEAAELARIAVTSEYHFQRLFSALAGIPLSEYIRRRRLTAAGARVLAGEETLLDVAVRYGYSSGEAFARAFRAVHGVGPGEASRPGGDVGGLRNLGPADTPACRHHATLRKAPATLRKAPATLRKAPATLRELLLKVPAGLVRRARKRLIRLPDHRAPGIPALGNTATI